MKKIIYIKFFVDVLKIFFLTSFTLVSIIWILQAVNFLDIVSEDGHSFKTYFSYSILNIPKIFSKTFLYVCNHINIISILQIIKSKLSILHTLFRCHKPPRFDP